MSSSKKYSTLRSVLNRSLLTATALAAALSLQAQQSELRQSKDRDHDHASHPKGKTDTTSFLKDAAQINMTTIKFAELGSQKAQSSELKQFSQKLEQDHQQAQQKLKTLAQKHNVMLPTSVDAKCEEELAKLRAKSGAEFDKEFAKGAVQGHAMAIAKFKDASSQLTDSDVSQYAKNMLTKLKEHQEESREVAKAVGIDQATIARLETETPEGVGTSGSSTESSSGTSTQQRDTDRKDTKQPQPQP